MSWWASESFWRLCLLGASGLTLLCQSRATGQRAEANQSLQKVPGVTVQYGGDSIIRGGFWGYYGVYIYIYMYTVFRVKIVYYIRTYNKGLNLRLGPSGPGARAWR